jgi:6,7-dimethyl-8-ribityllumazine synthase
MTSFVDEIKAVLKVCGNIHPDEIFEETISFSDYFQIPITAKFLAMSEYVDVIIILIDSSHGFEGETDATSIAALHGIMDIGLHYNVPIIFGNTYRNTYSSSYEIGKTALEMALMRWEALPVVAYEQEGSGVVYVGAFTAVLLLFLLFGIVIKKSGIITDKKAIFAKIMCFRKEYDKVEETETLPATLA